MNSKKYDVAIIGGGIVGCAVGRALLKNKKMSLIIIEAESGLAAHQTGNNSGVIHSGLYYKPGSLKAKNCVEGRAAMYSFCREYGIPHEQCGKLVVAVDQEEVPRLNELEKRGTANGIKGIKRLKKEELKDYEPNVTGVEGLYIPETGIVDYVAVTNKYAELICSEGGGILKNTRVTAVKREADELVIETTNGALHCKNLINCAGLQSDRIAKMSGVDPQLKIVPFRGEYYKLVPTSQHLIKNLIYPVPDPQFPFLGVHFTRMIKGGVEAGPNAVFAFKREGYKKTDISIRDLFDCFNYRGFWIMSLKYWKTGVAEMYRSYFKSAFVNALQKLVPGLKESDVYPAGAGVRAQALESNGFLVDDFRIVEAKNMVHVLNAPSPAATASISIGEKIAAMAVKNFE